jgi:hypothetical protein
MVTTATTTVETAELRIADLPAGRIHAEVAHYRRALDSDQYFGETYQEMVMRHADAAWWLDRFAAVWPQYQPV